MINPLEILDQLPQDDVARYTLDNGLTVLLRRDLSAPVAAVQYWVKTGSIHEGARLGTGVSHYLEHMMFKGTSRRSYSDITQDLNAAGANVNAYTTLDRTVYYTEGPSSSIDTQLDVLTDIVFHSLIDAEEAAKEKDVILREIDMYLDDPDSCLMQSVFRTAFRVHPYRYPVIGEKSLFSGLDHEDLRAYYEGRYAPNNAVLIIVGDIDLSATRRLIEKQHKGIAMRRLLPSVISEEPGQLGVRHEVQRGDYQITRGAMSFKVPGLRHEDAPGIDVLASVIGSGHSSRLWKYLRDEKQLVHHISASAWNPGASGLFWVGYMCDHGKEEEVHEAVWGELNRVMEEGITEEELSKAVRRRVMAEVNARKTVSGQAGRLGTFEVSIGDLSYPRFYFDRLSRVDVGSLKELSSRYFDRRGLSIALLAGQGEEGGAATDEDRQTLPDFEEHQLSNGIRVLLQAVEGLPKVHVRTVSLGGPLYEGAGNRGLSALMSTMLARDTEKNDAAAVAEKIEGLGGSFNEFAGNNTFGLSLELLTSDIEEGMHLLADGIMRPVFDKHSFEVEREGQMAQIRECLDDAVDSALMRLRSTFFGDHPYCCDCYGDLDSLDEADTDKARAIYEKLLVPSNFLIAVSGSFDPVSLLNYLESAFGTMTGDVFERNDLMHDRPAQTGRELVKTDKEQAVVFAAYPDVGVTDENFYVGELLDEVYSGMSSRLFDIVREQGGMAYFVTAARMVGVSSGMFYFYAGTTHEQAPAVLEAVKSEVKRIQEGGIDTVELERCKTRLKAQKQLSLQTASSRCMQAALSAAYGEPVNDWKNYGSKIDAVTADDLQKFALRLTDERRLEMIFSQEA